MTIALVAAAVVTALAAHWWLWRCGGRWGRFVVPALYLGLVAYGVWSGRFDTWWDWGKATGGLVLLLTAWGEWRTADMADAAATDEPAPSDTRVASDRT